MGMLIEGLNLVRDFWNTLHDAGELGTGTTQETGQDTDLETPIAGSESTTITNTTADQLLKKEIKFLGVNGTGDSATEMIWKTQSPEKAGSRVTFPAQTYDTTSDFKITTRWYFRGRRG